MINNAQPSLIIFYQGCRYLWPWLYLYTQKNCTNLGKKLYLKLNAEFWIKNILFLFQFQHPNPSSQNMAGPETSTNVTVQLEVNCLAWIPEKINWTSVETVVCASSSEMVVIWIIFSIEFVVMCLALFGLCCLLRSNHAVPLFVMNLFLCDIIQICAKPVLNFCTLTEQKNVFLFVFHVYIMSIIVNIGFMVCISVERYIMIKYPVWVPDFIIRVGT